MGAWTWEYVVYICARERESKNKSKSKSKSFETTKPGRMDGTKQHTHTPGWWFQPL